jgi:hemolysin III
VQNTASQYTVEEERVHAVSHGVGVLLSAAGLAWMLDLSIGTADPWRIIASCVYGASLIGLFLASTLYHTFHASRWSHLFKLLDHCAIYLLVAGSYTPFLLVAMRTETGWWLLGAVWTLAVVGVLTKLRFRHRYPWLSLTGYLLMGWLILIALPEVAEAVGAGAMIWLVAGGVSYTVGALFYMAKRLPFNHAIWHLFVLTGAICHFLGVVWYVLPARGVLPTSG